MSVILIMILVFICVFIAVSVVLSRVAYKVKSARDTEYLELEGNWIHYRVTGGGPPVLLVHGWLSSSRVWEPLADRLAQRFTVYSIDLSGFGDSDKPVSGYGIRYGSRLLYAFCAHFGLTRIAVVGHDFGGAMAVKLAADHQDVVGRLVLVATPADEEQVDLPTFLWLATLPIVGPVFYTLGRFLRPLRRLWMRPFVLFPEDLAEEVVDDAGKSTPAAVNETLKVARREIGRGRLARQAGILKVPTLVLAGEDDRIVDPRAAEDWSRTFSAAEIGLLDECGHLPMLELPDKFNAQILAFLTGDSRYLVTDALEVDEEVALAAETPEELDPQMSSESEASSTDVRERHNGGNLPDHTPEEASSSYDSSDQSANRDSQNLLGNGVEPSSKDHKDYSDSRSEAVGPIMPEVPKDLFKWPDSLKKPRVEDSSHEPDRSVREERGEEDEEPGDPD
jgi:pimeloyl-ACP methyl ester carboxylesterase